MRWSIHVGMQGTIYGWGLMQKISHTAVMPQALPQSLLDGSPATPTSSCCALHRSSSSAVFCWAAVLASRTWCQVDPNFSGDLWKQPYFTENIRYRIQSMTSSDINGACNTPHLLLPLVTTQPHLPLMCLRRAQGGRRLFVETLLGLGISDLHHWICNHTQSSEKKTQF